MEEQTKLKFIKSNILIILIILCLLLTIGNLIFKKSVSKEEKAAIHLNLALLHRSNIEMEKAIKEIEKAIEIYPKYDLAYSMLADVYFQLGEFDDALNSYEKAISLKEDPEYYFDMGNVYYRMGTLEEALNQYRKVIELNPNAANTYLAIANTLLDLKKFTESKTYYDKVLEMDYYNSNAHNDIAAYYEQIGGIEKAIQEYEIALQINPDNLLAKRNLERIRGLR